MVDLCIIFHRSYKFLQICNCAARYCKGINREFIYLVDRFRLRVVNVVFGKRYCVKARPDIRDKRAIFLVGRVVCFNARDDVPDVTVCHLRRYRFRRRYLVHTPLHDKRARADLD